MEDLGEFLGIVAGYQNFRAVDFVKDILPFEQALRQFGIR